MDGDRQTVTALTDEQYAVFVRLQMDELTSSDKEQLRHWQQQAGFNDAWEKTLDVWDEIGFLTPPSMSVDQPVVRTQRWLTFTAVAAVLLVVVWVGQLSLWSTPGDYYKTARGEHLTVNLSDGSKALLGPLSELTVHYTDQTRQFTLRAGEGYFDVFADKSRPFVVITPQGNFEAVGTQFNVLLNADSAQLAVIEGTVKISALQANSASTAAASFAVQGELAELDSNGEVAIEQQANVANIAAWTTGRLVFEGERLDAVIEKVNLHSKYQIILRDSELADKTLYGVFNIGDSQAFIDALKTAFNVRTIETVDSTLILAPQNQ